MNKIDRIPTSILPPGGDDKELSVAGSQITQVDAQGKYNFFVSHNWSNLPQVPHPAGEGAGMGGHTLNSPVYCTTMLFT